MHARYTLATENTICAHVYVCGSLKGPRGESITGVQSEPRYIVKFIYRARRDNKRPPAGYMDDTGDRRCIYYFRFRL